MKRVFILPGYTLETNKTWAFEVKKSLDPFFDADVNQWSHWLRTGSFKSDEEAKTFFLKIQKYPKVSIIAKSIGTLVAVKVIKIAGMNLLDKVILCGIPINDLKEEDFKEYYVLKDFPNKDILIFQNSDDPHGNYNQAFSFLDKINPKIVIKCRESSNHDYPYIEEFKNFLLSQGSE